MHVYTFRQEVQPAISKYNNNNRMLKRFSCSSHLVWYLPYKKGSYVMLLIRVV